MSGSEFGSVANDVSLALDKITLLTEQIITKDNNEALNAKAKIERSNACPGDEIERWQTDADNLVKKLREAAPRPGAEWTTHFADNADKPAAMHAIDDEYGRLDSALMELFSKLENMAVVTHWKGRGAEAYLKQLPYQKAALGELWSLATTERDGLDQTALMLQAIMQAVAAGFSGLVDRLQGILESSSLPDIYYQRTVDATAACLGLDEELHDLSQGTEWKTSVDQLVSDYGTAEKQLQMFADTDAWPSATNPASAAPPPSIPTPGSLMPAGALVSIGTLTSDGVAADAALNVNDARYD